MLYDIFLILLVVVDVIFLGVCTLDGKAARGLWGLVGFVAIAFLAGLPVISFVQENWRDILTYVGLYLAAGIPWAFFKWWRYAVKSRDAFTEWLATHPQPVRGQPDLRRMDSREVREDESEYAFQQRVASYSRDVPFPVKLNTETREFWLPTDKSRITAWLAYWPFSILGTFLNDFVLRLWETLYEWCSGVFRRISLAVFADLNRR